MIKEYIMIRTLALVGFVAAALAGAPVAAADINISGINLPIGDGTANASFGNAAAAFNGGTASATGGGFFNVAYASGEGANAVVNTGGGLNVAAAVGPGSEAKIIRTPPSFGGTGNIVIAGRDATAVSNNTQLSLSAALCGGSVNAQSQRIRISANSCLNR
jgi:hypothetical protein